MTPLVFDPMPAGAIRHNATLVDLQGIGVPC